MADLLETVMAAVRRALDHTDVDALVTKTHVRLLLVDLEREVAAALAAGERDTTEAGEGLAPMIERLIRRYEDRLHEAVVPPDQVAWAIYTGVVSDLRDALAARPAPVTGKGAPCSHETADGLDDAPDGPNKRWRCHACGEVYTDAGQGDPETAP